MSHLNNPENALKRVEGLLDVGQEEPALEFLVRTMDSKRYKSQWTKTGEAIAIKALDLCVDLRNLTEPRHIMVIFRNQNQSSNLESLEKVVRHFRKRGQELVASAKKKCEAQGASAADREVENLDELETPQKALRCAQQTKATREKEANEKAVVDAIRYLWESFKQIMEVFRANGKTEDLYHDIARSALDFCVDNGRKFEFKKLSDMIRNNYLHLFRRQNPTTGAFPPAQVNPLNPDTIGRLIVTKLDALHKSSEMGLFRECFNTADDLHGLLLKLPGKPKASHLADYYKFLSQICWKSSNHLWHAFSATRNFNLYRIQSEAGKGSKAFAKAEQASAAVLATICIETLAGSDENTDGLGNVNTDANAVEKHRRMANLFNIASLPSKETLMGDLSTKSILVEAYPVVQQLYALLEQKDIVPIDLCKLVAPLLEEVEAQSVLAQYVPQIRKVVVFKLLKQLSTVYANITVEQIRDLISPVVDFTVAEKWMITQAHESFGITLQMDYVKKAVVFGNGASDAENDLSSLRQPLKRVNESLQTELFKLDQNLIGELVLEKQRKSRKTDLFSMIEDRVLDHRDRILTHTEEIRRRNEDKQEKSLKESVLKAQAEAIVAKKAAQAEKQRIAQEQKRQAEEKADAKKKELDVARMKDVLAEMKNTFSPEQKISVPKDKTQAAIDDALAGAKKDGKKTSKDTKEKAKESTQFTMQELLANNELLTKNFTFETLCEARDAITKKERQEKVRARRAEMKRIDHTARALREIESKLIGPRAKAQRIEDEAFFMDLDKKTKEKCEKEHAEALIVKTKLAIYVPFLESWLEKRIGSQLLEFEKKLDIKRKQEFLKKCTRAKARYEEKVREEEEREKREKAEMEEIERQKQLKQEQVEKERAEAKERRRLQEEAAEATRAARAAGTSTDTGAEGSSSAEGPSSSAGEASAGGLWKRREAPAEPVEKKAYAPPGQRNGGDRDGGNDALASLRSGGAGKYVPKRGSALGDSLRRPDTRETDDGRDAPRGGGAYDKFSQGRGGDDRMRRAEDSQSTMRRADDSFGGGRLNRADPSFGRRGEEEKKDDIPAGDPLAAKFGRGERPRFGKARLAPTGEEAAGEKEEKRDEKNDGLANDPLMAKFGNATERPKLNLKKRAPAAEE